MSEIYYNIKQTALILNQTEKCVRIWLKEGSLKGELVIGIWKVSNTEIERFRNTKKEFK